MKVVRAQIFRYKLPLLQAFARQEPANLISEGLVVVLQSEDGFIGYGEITKASLLGSERFEDAQNQLCRVLTGENNVDDVVDAPVKFAVSSAKFGIELARKKIDVATYLGLERQSVETIPALSCQRRLASRAQHSGMAEGCAQQGRVALDSGLRRNDNFGSLQSTAALASLSSVSLNATLDASNVNFVDQAQSAHVQGFRVLKIKVGDGALNVEIARIRELVAILGKNVSLRLDANKKLNLSQAVEFAQALKKVKIEYFEEPVQNLDDLDEFYRLTNVKVGLDETVLLPEFLDWCEHPAVDAYILKPSRMGSVDRLLEVMKMALASNRKFVLSSTYESGLGLAILAQFALVAQSADVAMGLGTSSFFVSDLIKPPFRPFRGQLMREDIIRTTQQVNLEASNFCVKVLDLPAAVS